MELNDRTTFRPNRRTLLRAGAGLTAVGALGSLTRASILAAQTTPQFGSAEYEAALKLTDGIRGVFQSPALDAMSVAGDNVNHLLLLQLKNWLNSFQFAYKNAPEDLHTLSATYASANLLTYGDAVWEKYKMGEKYEITDPTTGAPAIRNVFWPSRFGPDAPKDITAKDNYYQDTGIEVLQERGTIFLSCNNSLNGHAAAAVADGRAPAGAEAADVAADIAANLVPGAVLVPAVVGEVSRAQTAGYSLVFIPNFSL
jgi:intracellular sulfur oxidation DsrE/DsrF family protein